MYWGLWLRWYGHSQSNRRQDVALRDDSDEKLKDNITIIDSVLGKISDIRCANYTLKSDKSLTKRIGFIAQDFVGKFDEVVEKPSRIPGESEEKYLGLKYSEVVPILMKAIQEQQSMIEDLKSQNELLKTKIENIENKIWNHSQ